MKREEVRAFLKAGVDAVKLSFDAGRLSEFNKVADKGFPFAWIYELQAASDFGGSGATLIDDWSVTIRIVKQDKADSIQDEYEHIIDDCDHIARQLIWQYNRILQTSTSISTANQNIYKLITISQITRPPVIKWGADVMTGVDLVMNLNSPDKTDVCP